MTINEALALREGDHVTHPTHTLFIPDTGGGPTRIPLPLRVTKVWQNERRTIVRIRINSVGQDQWLDATSYDLPPAGKEWDRVGREWLTPAELRQRKLERSGKTPLPTASV